MLARLKSLLFENRNARQTVAKNVFWLSFSQIIGRVVRAAIIIYSARALGAAGYGVFSYAIGLAGLFTIFADIGISQILTREIVQKPDERYYYFSTAFFLKAIILIFTSLLIIFVAPHASKIDEAKALIPFIAIIVLFDNLRDFSFSLFRASEKMEREAIINVVMNFTITILGFLALFIKKTPAALTISYAVGVGIGFFISFWFLREYYARAFVHFKASLLHPILSAAYPIALLTLLGAFMLNTDLIMLGWWRSPEEIGYYSAGQKIIQLLYTVPSILATSLFPVFSRLVRDKNYERVRGILERSLGIAFAVALPIAIGGIIVAQPFLGFVYGKEYTPAAGSFQILLLTPLFIFPQLLLSNLVLAYNEQKRLQIPVAIGAFGNILFNFLLIPRYGIIGCSLATVIAQILNVGSTWYITKRVNAFRIIPRLKKIGIATFVSGLTAFALNTLGLHVAITVFTSGAVYIATLFLMQDDFLKEALALLGRAKISSS